MVPREFLGLAQLLADETRNGDSRGGDAFAGVKLPPLAWAFCGCPTMRLPEYPHDRRTVAYHEAGHAVFHVLANLPMTSAVVYPKPRDDGEYGRINIDLTGIAMRAAEINEKDIPRSRYQLAALYIACAFLAGRVAEMELHELDVNGWIGRDCRDERDFKNAIAVLRDAFDHDLPRWWCWLASREVLRAHWPWVVAVATVLETRFTISTDEIARLREVPDSRLCDAPPKNIGRVLYTGFPDGSVGRRRVAPFTDQVTDG